MHGLTYITLPFMLLQAVYGQETHMLGKRDAVCAQDFRVGVQARSCIGQPNYAISGTGLTINPRRTTAVVTASGCDHIVELQFLDLVLKKTKVCDALSKSPASSAAQLEDAAQAVSNAQNLAFLASSVNGAKANVVSGAFRGRASTNRQVNTYLQDTRAKSLAVTGALDTIIEGLVADLRQASAAAVAANPSPVPGANGRTPRATPAQAAAAAFKAATDAITFANGGITTEWNNVLANTNDAPALIVTRSPSPPPGNAAPPPGRGRQPGRSASPPPRGAAPPTRARTPVRRPSTPPSRSRSPSRGRTGRP